MEIFFLSFFSLSCSCFSSFFSVVFFPFFKISFSVFFFGETEAMCIYTVYTCTQISYRVYLKSCGCTYLVCCVDLIKKSMRRQN